MITICSRDGDVQQELKSTLNDQFNVEVCSKLPDQTDNSELLIVDYSLLNEASDEYLKSLLSSSTPVILTWAHEGEDHRHFAFEHGYDDFISPPFYHDVICCKVRIHLSLAKLQQSGEFMSFEGKESKEDHDCVHDHEYHVIQDAAILSLATIARIRDHSTGNHILRTQHYVRALAEYLKDKEPFKQELDESTIELFYKTAALHDIGKVGVPDNILQKPGSLTDEEYELMKQHTILGYKAVKSAELLVQREVHGKAAKFLTIAKQVTLSHHERWDGHGYPQGLKAEEIPIVARLMAVADVYDAMISRRPYKGALGHQKTVEAIVGGSGTHFDPKVIEAFEALQETFKHISVKLEDHFPSEADLTLHSMTDLVRELDSHVL